jgi:type II secretory pathway component PulF
MDYLESANRWFALASFQKERSMFYRDLAMSLAPGVQTPIDTFLRDTYEQQPKSPRGVVAKLMFERSGEKPALSYMLGPFVPPIDRVLLSACDDASSKDVSEFLDALANIVEENAARQTKFLKAIMSPLISSILLVGLFLLNGFSILPAIAETYPVANWQGFAQLFYKVCTFLASWKGAVLGVVVAACVSWVIWSVNNFTGTFRNWLDDHIWPYSIIRGFKACDFLTAYSLMLRKSRLADERVIASTIGAAGTPWLRWHLNEVSQRLAADPDSLGSAFNTGLLPKECFWRLESYARDVKTGFGDAVSIAARDTLVLENRNMEKVTARINLILLLMVVGSIGWMYASDMAPIQKMVKEIRRGS